MASLTTRSPGGNLTLAAISTANTSGDKTLVTGAAGKVVRVHRIFLKVDGAMSITFKDATGGNALTGAIPLGTTELFSVYSADGSPLFQSAPGADFVVNQSTTQKCLGWIAYTLDPP